MGATYRFGQPAETRPMGTAAGETAAETAGVATTAGVAGTGAVAATTAVAAGAGAAAGTTAGTGVGAEDEEQPYPDFYFQMSKKQQKNWRKRHRQHKRQQNPSGGSLSK